MTRVFASEAELAAAAAEAGRAWLAAGLTTLKVGLVGDLGAGKTSFVRALLRGLGHAGRVPSPTYTLLEHYELAAVAVVHLDLYRLTEPRDLDFLGVRDFLATPRTWIFVEWPEKGGRFLDALDLSLELAIGPDERRDMTVRALSECGRAAAAAWLGTDFKISL